MAMPFGLGLGAFAVTDIAHAIQLAVAPVFLLNGVGVLLGVLTSRLSRIVDRARVQELRLPLAAEAETRDLLEALRIVRRRARYMNRAITLATVAALLVAIVVAMIFLAAFLPFSLVAPVGYAFILAMASLTGALVFFLIEIRIATASLRIGPPTIPYPTAPPTPTTTSEGTP
jgi:hypothetical protein